MWGLLADDVTELAVVAVWVCGGDPSAHLRLLSSSHRGQV